MANVTKRPIADVAASGKIAYSSVMVLCLHKRSALSLILAAKHGICHHFCVCAVISEENNPDEMWFSYLPSRSWLSFPGLPRGCNPVACVSSLGHSVLLHAAHAGHRQPGKGLGDDLLMGWPKYLNAGTYHAAHPCSLRDKHAICFSWTDIAELWHELSSPFNVTLSPLCARRFPCLCFFILCVIFGFE